MRILSSKSTSDFPSHSELNPLVYNVLQVLPPTSLTSPPTILSLGSPYLNNMAPCFYSNTPSMLLFGAFPLAFFLFIKCPPHPHIWMVSSLNFLQVSIQMSSYGRMFTVCLSTIHWKLQEKPNVVCFVHRCVWCLKQYLTHKKYQ